MFPEQGTEVDFQMHRRSSKGEDHLEKHLCRLFQVETVLNLGLGQTTV